MKGLLRADRCGMDAEAIEALTGGSWIRTPDPSCAILGASIDTRSLIAGQIFFALRGDRVDGHDFLDAAARVGASVAVVERDIDEPPRGLGVLRVEDGRSALSALANGWRRSLRDGVATETTPGLKVIGVTGSNGKTTTVRMIHAALKAGGLNATRSQKSFNNELGVPLTLLGASPSDHAVVCEMGMNAPGEIATLCRIAEPDVGVVTSIGMAHMEAFGSLDGIAHEKSTIVRSLGPDGLGVVCGDSPQLDGALGEVNPERLIRLGTQGSGWKISELGSGLFEDGRDGAWCMVCEPGGDTTRVRTLLPGEHNARNAAIAFAVARTLGIRAQDAAKGIEKAPPPPMRLEAATVELASGSVRIINDAYNANPDSVRAALRLLGSGRLDGSGASNDHQASFPSETRRIAVIGEMLEMGSHAESAHLSIAREMAVMDGISAVVLIGSWAEQMAGEVESIRPGCVLHVEMNAQSGWPAPVVTSLRGGDIVLLKGSRGVRLERLMDEIRGIGAV